MKFLDKSMNESRKKFLKESLKESDRNPLVNFRRNPGIQESQIEMNEATSERIPV